MRAQHIRSYLVVPVVLMHAVQAQLNPVVTIGVLANDLLKASVNQNGAQEGRLVLVSPVYPEAEFNAR